MKRDNTPRNREIRKNRLQEVSKTKMGWKGGSALSPFPQFTSRTQEQRSKNQKKKSKNKQE